MLYLGHFSFDEITEEDDGRFGYFSCMVEAESPEHVEKAFKKLILDMRKKKTLFTEPAYIYLDTFIEIGALPPTGVVTRFTSYNGKFAPDSITTYLPGEDKGECEPYFWYPEDRPDVAKKIDAGEERGAVPFISFEPTAAQKRKAEIHKLQKERERAARLAVPEKKKPFARKDHW
jgi:hypothetical protein